MCAMGWLLLLGLCGSCVGWPPSLTLLWGIDKAPTHGIAVKEGVAFLAGVGTAPGRLGVTVWNTTVAKAPAPLAGFDTEADDIGVVIDGSFLFVTLRRRWGGSMCCNALQVLDISNPALPRNVSYVPYGSGQANFSMGKPVVLRGVLYVATMGGLHAVDVSDPHHPRDLGAVVVEPSAGAVTNDLSTDGRFLYVFSLDVVYVLDMLSELSFKVLGKLPAGAYALDQGEGVLVTLHSPGYRFWNTSALPSSLPELGSAPSGTTQVDGISAAASTLFISGSGAVTCISYATPAAPRVWAGNVTVSAGNAQQMLWEGGILYVAGWSRVALIETAL